VEVGGMFNIVYQYCLFPKQQVQKNVVKRPRHPLNLRCTQREKTVNTSSY